VKLGPNVAYFKPKLDLDEPKLLALTSLAKVDVIGCSYEWWPWEDQLDLLPASKTKTLPLGIRAFADKRGFMDITMLASYNCWWSIARADLFAFGTFMGLELERGSSLVDVLVELIRYCIPGIRDDELQEILHLRLARLTAHESPSEAIMEMDEALEVVCVYIILFDMERYLTVCVKYVSIHPKPHEQRVYISGMHSV
jgi:hypothetical protein